MYKRGDIWVIPPPPLLVQFVDTPPPSSRAKNDFWAMAQELGVTGPPGPKIKYMSIVSQCTKNNIFDLLVKSTIAH